MNDLWDHSDPELSEQRFREALSQTGPDGQFILHTQIARTYGLRRDFDRARGTLQELTPRLDETSAEGQVRYWIELGRTHCSAAHPREALTDESRQTAREAYLRGFELANRSALHGLAVDALHMMTMVEPEADAQIDWNRKAIAYVEESDHPDAKKWEGSLRNNLGYSLHSAGRLEEALKEFERALAYRESTGNPTTIRVAKWMIAWTLRGLGRLDEALNMQLALEQECAYAGADDPYVFDELEAIFRAKGDSERADHYAAKSQTLSDIPC